MTNMYYFYFFKRLPNLNKPIYLNEKVQWLKLNYLPKDEIAIKATDKYKVREYVESKGYKDILVPLIGVWDAWTDINWSVLPRKFVLKCNHGSRYNLIVTDKNNHEEKLVGRKINQWMTEDFSLYNSELHYSTIPRKIICEEFLEGEMSDYKFFCFHGEPKFFFVSKEPDDQYLSRRMTYYNIDGSILEVKNPSHERIESSFELTNQLTEMISIAKNLSKDFLFVRVDLMVVKNKIYFSELTFTPGAGLMQLEPTRYYKIFGDYLKLPFKKIN